MNNVLSGDEGNILLHENLKNNKPFSLSRIGIGEIRLVYNKLNNVLSAHDYYSIEAGGVREDSREFFFDEYIKGIREADINAYWVGIDPQNTQALDVILNTLSPQSTKIMHRAIEPFYFDNPWSKSLVGKKVLIISPFTESITEQHPKLSKIWGDKKLMPEFELLTLKSKFLFSPDSPSWKDTLNNMKAEISNMDFDVALLGCSLYGLPLVSHIKELNKSAIYIGGALQLLFGIKGKRWDIREDINKLYNAHWVRPKSSEIPSKYVGLDDGTYW